MMLPRGTARSMQMLEANAQCNGQTVSLKEARTAMTASAMKKDKRTEYITRDTILKLLSDDEVARVSTAETAASLAAGDEYIDLEEPDRGVQQALGKTTTPMGHVLPKKAVHEKTWHEIVTLLSSPHAATAKSPPK